MKNLLALAILFTALQADYETTCHRDGDEMICTTEENYYDKQQRERKEDSYRQEMQYNADMARLEAEIYRLDHE